MRVEREIVPEEKTQMVSGITVAKVLEIVYSRNRFAIKENKHFAKKNGIGFIQSTCLQARLDAGENISIIAYQLGGMFYCHSLIEEAKRQGTDRPYLDGDTVRFYFIQLAETSGDERIFQQLRNATAIMEAVKKTDANEILIDARSKDDAELNALLAEDLNARYRSFPAFESGFYAVSSTVVPNHLGTGLDMDIEMTSLIKGASDVRTFFVTNAHMRHGLSEISDPSAFTD